MQLKDNNMKQIKMNLKFCIWFVCTIVGINICWQLFEMFIYGEIQPRIVDSIISLFWSGAIFFAYNFRKIVLRIVRKKHDKVNINTWWLRKPIYSNMFTNEYVFIENGVFNCTECESNVKKGSDFYRKNISN